MARGGKRRSSNSRLNQTAAGREEVREARSRRHRYTEWMTGAFEVKQEVSKTGILTFVQVGAS